MCLWELRVWVGKCVCFGGCVAVNVRVCVFVGTQSLGV